MGPGEHRPHDEEYWQRPWARALFAGDLFEAIPFGEQPTILYTPVKGEASGKHFLGEIAFGYGLLITPTCDMTEQHGERSAAHPFRTLVPVVPLETVVTQTGAIERSLGLLRSRDAITPYMYLPPLAGALDGEHVACLFRPTLVSDGLLREPPRRVAQLQAPARRHLKVKLAAYWGRAAIDSNDLRLHERDEHDLLAEGWPPSPYDPADVSASRPGKT
ncbi:MAG TPA: hypothetical protein VFF79_19745 [Conexibacter sp.]|jgi:hypothetical protein|nr:hypothetical protein [Conexibacter sp.]